MNDVVYRRIRGRIVPIKRKKEHSASSPSASVVSGVGVAAVGGLISAKLDRKQADFINAAKNAKGKPELKRFVAKNRLEGIRASIASSRIKKSSALIGSALIGLGVYKSLKNTDLSEGQKTAISTTSGLGANVVLRAIHTKVLGKTTLKFAAKHAFWRVLVRGSKL
jgi:hypothetical protein